MCGIVGIIYFNDNIVNEKELIESVKIISHRGPDHQDVFVSKDKKVGLGHARLSIIDLTSHAHQPMTNEDGTIHVVYNGEIYNFHELRKELIKKGHTFRSNTDTEVIIHQYEEDGASCVDKFNGMFAIALWDEKNETLFLARDRVGIKPLNYYIDENKIIFASEIKSILHLIGGNFAINWQSVSDFLTFRYVPAPDSIFKGIQKLLPCHILTVKNKHFTIKSYWELKYKEAALEDKNDDDYYLKKFDELLKDSVKKQLVSDVPLGVFLSGGLDSSAVTAILSELGVNKIKTFSVGFDEGEAFNELEYARKVSNYFKTDHNEIIIGVKEFLDFLPSFVHYTDEPLADLASIPLYYIAKLARQKVTVILSGEGSDELLAGYSSFANILKHIDKQERFTRLPLILQTLIKCGLPKRTRTYKLFDNHISKYAEIMLPSATNTFSSEEKYALFKDKGLADFDSLRHVLKNYFEPISRYSTLDQILYIYTKTWLPGDLLLKADSMTMANSLELRVPFLDHRLVEFAANLPLHLKIKKTQKGEYVNKYILKKLFEGRLPHEIIYRKKLGFPVPAYKWLKSEVYDFANDSILSANSFSCQFFEKKILKYLLEMSRKGDCDSQHKVWSLIILNLWHDKNRLRLSY